MPNAERAAKLNAAVAKAFGEDFTFTARKQAADVDLPRVADPARATFTRAGTWFSGSKVRHTRARGHADDHAQGEAVSAPRADFAISDLPWMPIEGDLCKREHDGAIYSVARSLPNGFDRVVVYFTAKKR